MAKQIASRKRTAKTSSRCERGREKRQERRKEKLRRRYNCMRVTVDFLSHNPIHGLTVVSLLQYTTRHGKGKEEEGRGEMEEGRQGGRQLTTTTTKNWSSLCCTILRVCARTIFPRRIKKTPK